MKLYNYMEEVVRDTLDKLISEREDVCKCQKCKLDMVACALNRLPPKYMVSDKGIIFTKLQEVEVQFRADVIRELTKAITLIGNKPQH
jgi:competence protein ComFB